MGTLHLVIDGLAAVNRLLAGGFRLLAWTFLVFMTLSIVLQVFCRKVLNSSLFWPEDVSLMMMIWVAFATAPIAYRMGANVALDPLHRLLRGRGSNLLQLLLHGLILVMLVILLNEALALIGRTKIRANSIPLSMKYVYMIMPIGFAAMVLVGVELALRNMVGLIRPDSPHAVPPGMSEPSIQQA